jgi:hypothetical protein
MRIAGAILLMTAVGFAEEPPPPRVYVEAARASAAMAKSLLVCRDTHEGCSSWAGMVRM